MADSGSVVRAWTGCSGGMGIPGSDMIRTQRRALGAWTIPSASSEGGNFERKEKCSKEITLGPVCGNQYSAFILERLGGCWRFLGNRVEWLKKVVGRVFPQAPSRKAQGWLDLL